MADHAVAHPTAKGYIRIAVILAVLTAIEVGLFYIDEAMDMGGWDGPLLIILSFIKFVAVIGWFMHLRFESAMLSRFFMGGFILAMVLYAVVLADFILRLVVTP